MKSLDDMFNSGLYINDLSMHDSSRDLVLAGTQQSAELKLALDQVSDVTVNDVIVCAQQGPRVGRHSISKPNLTFKRIQTYNQGFNI